MDSNSSVAVMFVSAFAATAFIIHTILYYRLKSRLIKSGLMDAENLKLLNQLHGDNKQKSLKWALLLFFGGLGLILLQFIPYTINNPLPYGIEAIFIALGFFIYYNMAYRKADRF
ncbi:hypothetical protein HH214_11720 [Mucilaginibacter robiniae]|uniref:DUF6249 domain-containing protein n=1 Tax=Mucilaginibacter robiniae TaxID=2728022 RepID=A0A7L5DZT2_9SPHI|nr:DUF6249 domain-containing protein [Mucilaginibacter robiniae]QJD96495.1 hypothetical protein HH214_11720 [Mucilaginibacter robiniae]